MRGGWESGEGRWTCILEKGQQVGNGLALAVGQHGVVDAVLGAPCAAAAAENLVQQAHGGRRSRLEDPAAGAHSGQCREAAAGGGEAAGSGHASNVDSRACGRGLVMMDRGGGGGVDRRSSRLNLPAWPCSS